MDARHRVGFAVTGRFIIGHGRGGPEQIFRLRSEANAIELRGKKLVDASLSLYDEKLREIAVQDAEALITEAKALRRQAKAIEQG